MSTTIKIDNTLFQQAMQDTGEPTERAVLEAGLHLLIQMRAQAAIRDLRGQVSWEGDLDETRRSRFID